MNSQPQTKRVGRERTREGPPLGRYAVMLPAYGENRSEAYVIVDRETRGVLAMVYLGGEGNLVRRMLRAKSQADAMCRALNRMSCPGERPQ